MVMDYKEKEMNLTSPGSDWVGEDACLEQVLHVPLGSIFVLPCPEDPACRLLETVELSIDEFTNVALVGSTEASHVAVVLAGATANVG